MIDTRLAALVVVVLLFSSLAAEAQQAEIVSRVGMLLPFAPPPTSSSSPALAMFTRQHVGTEAFTCRLGEGNGI